MSLNTQQLNAVATADMHLRNAGLPTYSESVRLVRDLNSQLQQTQPQAEPPLKQEFNEAGQHRLVNTETGETSLWAGYAGAVRFQGRVSVTDYYTGCGEKIVTPDQFATYACVVLPST